MHPARDAWLAHRHVTSDYESSGAGGPWCSAQLACLYARQFRGHGKIVQWIAGGLGSMLVRFCHSLQAIFFLFLLFFVTLGHDASFCLHCYRSKKKKNLFSTPPPKKYTKSTPIPQQCFVQKLHFFRFFQNYFWTTAHHSDEGVRPDELEAASAHGWGSTEKAEAEGEGAKAAVSCDRFR